MDDGPKRPAVAASMTEKSIPLGRPGLRYVRGYLSPEQQRCLLAAVQAVLQEAPLFSPTMPRSGKPLSVRMSNCGPLGWVTDSAGYRYQPTHPETRRPWPAMPELVARCWEELADYAFAPEACLINFYGPAARMGLHQDRDEQDFAAPVVSLSLGATCLFRIGGLRRSDPTQSLRLASGDAVVLGGESRLIFHGVDRVIPGTSRSAHEVRRVRGYALT